ncbi:MAG: ABC-2 transporter permease [bacterium]
MATTRAIFRKELKSYFSSPVGYIYLVVFIVLVNWIFLRGFFLIGQASFRGLFTMLPWVFLLFIPAVTMRLWAEERKLGTDELLMTLPIANVQAVSAKFLASLAFVAISLALTLVLPLSGFFIGRPDPGPIICGYIGSLLVGGAYLSIGMFASNLTDNQVAAFVMGVLICFALFIIGENLVIMTLPATAAGLFRFLGLGAHFRSIARGVIDTRDLVYYFSVTVFFLFLNVRALETRR